MDDARSPQLLHRLPDDDYVPSHLQLLFMNRASRLFARSPQPPAESGSLSLRSIILLSLPSDPQSPTEPLRIGFSSPMNGVRSVASTDGVCQLRWANKKAVRSELRTALCFALNLTGSPPHVGSDRSDLERDHSRCSV